MNKDVRTSRILIVDDDAFTRKVVIQVLTNLGYMTVIEARDGDEALRALVSHNIDLMITDLEMPKLNGLELLKSIRSGLSGVQRDTRVVILTSYSNVDVIKVAFELDVNGFLVKPIKPVTTNEKVAKALGEEFKLKSSDEYQGITTDIKCLPASHQTESHVSAGVLKDEVGKKHYVQLPFKKLKPGMSLREPLKTKKGDTLLKEGYVLNALVIDRLQEMVDVLQQHSVWVFRPPSS